MRRSFIFASKPARWALAACALALIAPAALHAARLAVGQGGAVIVPGEEPLPAPALPTTLAEVQTYGDALSAHLENRMGGRAALLAVDAALKRAMRAPTQTVIAGEDGWLFYGAEDALVQHQGLVPLTDDARIAWLETLAALSAWGADHGAAVVAGAAPNKSRVYPERMPAWAGAPAPRRALAALNADADAAALGWVDLGPAVEAVKAERLAYFRTDTHWTTAGALAGVRTLIEALRAQRPDLPDASFPMIDVERVHGGDLHALSGGGPDETLTDIAPPGGVTPRTAIEDLGSDFVAGYRFTNPDARGRLVLIGDSFADVAAPLFAEAYGEVVFFHIQPGRLDAARVLAEPADAVVVLVVERYAARGLALTSEPRR